MAIHGHEWSSLMGKSLWARFFSRSLTKTIRFFWAYLPEKRESVWTECSRCSSACTLPWWALSFPNFQWANPVRHTQHVTRPQSLPRKKKKSLKFVCLWGMSHICVISVVPFQFKLTQLLSFRGQDTHASLLLSFKGDPKSFILLRIHPLFSFLI